MLEKEEQLNTIKCPYCDYEYLPGEIYMPKNFLGQPTDIDKDISGKIICYDGTPQELDETFTCTNCNRKFKVHADIKYSSTKLNTENMDDYESVKYKNRFVLTEE